MDGQALVSIFHAEAPKVIWGLTSLHLLHQGVAHHVGRTMINLNLLHVVQEMTLQKNLLHVVQAAEQEMASKKSKSSRWNKLSG